jgi:ribosomal protein RSM22 (predicted rRNA methylase)
MKKFIMKLRGEYILEMLVLLTSHTVIILRISKMLEKITYTMARNSPTYTQPERTLQVHHKRPPSPHVLTQHHSIFIL